MGAAGVTRGSGGARRLLSAGETLDLDRPYNPRWSLNITHHAISGAEGQTGRPKAARPTRKPTRVSSSLRDIEQFKATGEFSAALNRVASILCRQGKWDYVEAWVPAKSLGSSLGGVMPGASMAVQAFVRQPYHPEMRCVTGEP